MSSESESENENWRNVQFVQGEGDQMDLDTSEEDGDEDIQQEVEESEAEDERPFMGLGSGAATTFGLGSTSGLGSNAGLGSATGLGSKSTAGLDSMSNPTAAKPPTQKSNSRPGLGSSTRTQIPIDKDFASFEKYTKGIGSKLLLKMGYKMGSGLGADGSGIATPINVTLRPGKSGLGHGTVKREPKKEKKQVQPGYVQRENRWKKSRVRKPIYKSVQELLQEPEVPIVIRDMTGKQEKLIHDMAMTESRLKELRFNVGAIVRLVSEDIVKVGKLVQQESKRKQERVAEKEVLKLQMEMDKDKLERVKTIAALAKEIKTVLNSKSLKSIDGVIEILENYLKDLEEMKQEMVEYQIDTLVVALLSPILRPIFQHWNPLQDPLFAYDGLARLSQVLDRPSTDIMSPFQNMLYILWLPRLRSCIKYHKLTSNEWDVTNPDIAIKLIQGWKKLLPNWMCYNIANQLILPKLTKGVEEGRLEGRTGVGIHEWLFPWYAVYGDLLYPLWTDCRRKLQSYLSHWNVADPTGLALVKTWNEVFHESDQKRVVNESVLPKLIDYLRHSFVVDPLNQDVSPLLQVFEWKSWIPENLFAHLLETEFFNKFYDCLWKWLKADGADLKEITEWYKSWKGLFESCGLAKMEVVKQAFRTALDMMNQGTSVSKPTTFITTSQSKAKMVEEPSLGDLTFRDYVELLCSEADVAFIPTNKTRNGKDIYKLGNSFVYLEDGVLYIQKGKQYTYSTVEDAIELSK
jgi:tuftelin-interacting protein 11